MRRKSCWYAEKSYFALTMSSVSSRQMHGQLLMPEAQPRPHLSRGTLLPAARRGATRAAPWHAKCFAVTRMEVVCDGSQYTPVASFGAM